MNFSGLWFPLIQGERERECVAKGEEREEKQREDRAARHECFLKGVYLLV